MNYGRIILIVSVIVMVFAGISRGVDITGNGTNGHLAKFTNSYEIGDSVISESSGKIGIGITNPDELLHLYKSDGTLNLKMGSGSKFAYFGLSGGDGRVGISASDGTLTTWDIVDFLPSPNRLKELIIQMREK